MNANRTDIFPHENEILRGVQRFFLEGRWLGLYYHKNRTPSAPYSLYWADKPEPINTEMTDDEVFHVLAQIINRNVEEN